MIVDTILSWFGLTRTRYFNGTVFHAQVLEYEKNEYRLYLMDLRRRTPHANIKDEINVLLKDTPKGSLSFMSDLYRSAD